MSERPPLLTAIDARIAVDGVVAIDKLSLTTRGDHVALAGEPRALFAAISGIPLADPSAGSSDLAGEAWVTAGSLSLSGRDVANRDHLGIMGAAPLDPKLPKGVSATDHVAWSARLAGASKRTARDLAVTALTRVGLESARNKMLDTLATPARRATSLPQAIVMGPEVLVAESPLADLEGSAATFVLRALYAASEGRRALVSIARLDAPSVEGAIARGASHLVVLAGGDVAVEGTPAELFSAAKVLSLCVHGNVEPLRVELAARGIELTGGPTRFAARMPAGATPSVIVAAASRARTAVVEMIPILG